MRLPHLSFLGFRKTEEVPPVTLILPAAVCDAIDGASLICRPAGEEGIARVVVQLHGYNGWHYSDEGAARALARMFPDMNDRQQSQAVRRLGARVKAHLQRLELTEPRRRKWIDGPDYGSFGSASPDRY